MIDERENECPYDFKNIQFCPYHYNKLKLGAAGYYTFSGLEDDKVIEISTHDFFNGEHPTEVHHNKIDIDITDPNFIKHVQPLYRNIFIAKDKAYIKYNKIHAFCYDNTFFSPNLSYCTFIYGCKYNLINCALGSHIYFSIYCSSNEILSEQCTNLHLEHNSIKNIFKNTVYSCKLRHNCTDNIFQDNVQNVILGPGSNNNTFNGKLLTFTTGEHFDDNIVGPSTSVSFGGYCKNNNFGKLRSVICGGDIKENDMPIYIVNTTIGNSVLNCNAKVPEGKDITYKIMNSTIKNATAYTDFIFTENLHTMKYSIILCRGSEDVRKKVHCQIIDNDYQITITQNSNGEIKQYCEADLIA